MTERNKWTRPIWRPKVRKGPKLIHPLQEVPSPVPVPPEPKYPIIVHNPVATTLADPKFRPQRTKSPKLYNRKIKHKKGPGSRG